MVDKEFCYMAKLVENHKNRWTYSVFTRLILVFILIILPIYAVSTAIFISSRNELKEQFYYHTQARMNDFFAEFERDIFHTTNMLNYLFVDEDLTALAHSSDFFITFEDVQSINRLRGRLTLLSDTNDYIRSIGTYIPSIEMKLNSFGSDVSFDRIRYDTVVTLAAHQKETAFFTYNNNQIYLYIVPKGLLYDVEVPLFVIEAQLDMNYMFTRMTLDDIIPDSTFYFVVPDSRFVLSNADISQVDIIRNALTKSMEIDVGLIQELLGIDDSYFTVSMYSSRLNTHYFLFTSEDVVLGRINQFAWWYIALVVVSLFAVITFSSYTYKLIKKPVNLLTNAFEAVSNKDFDMRINEKHSYEFAFLFEAFNDTVENTQRLISEVYLQTMLANQAELKQLQAQINPHFLYNSFFILRARARKSDLDGVEKLCDMLGEYFKYTIKNDNADTVLAEEVRHAKIYADIQAVRFSNRVTVDFGTLNAHHQSIPVPKLILQPIIENAFKYGLEDVARNGALRVSFAGVNDNGIVVNIEDNCSESDDTKISDLRKIISRDIINSPSGLQNIHKRLVLFMKEGSGLDFFKSELGGLGVSVTLIP